MTITPEELNAIDDAAAKNAGRGISSLTIGDRRIDYTKASDLIDAKRKMAEEENGGIYQATFAPKGYF